MTKTETFFFREKKDRKQYCYKSNQYYRHILFFSELAKLF